MLRIQRLFISLFATLFFATALAAQTVQWSPDSGTLQEGKRYAINLEFNGCSPDGQPPQELSTDDIAVELGGGIQSITSGFFGRAQTSVQYTYQITARTQGRVVIPSFEVETDQGVMTVPPATFEVVEASVGNTGARPEEVLLSRFVATDDKIYQGEIFSLDYYAGAKQFRLTDLGEVDWTPNNLVTSGLEPVEKGAYTFDGDTYNAVRYSARALATEAGSLTQDDLTQQIMLVVGQRNRGGFFPETVTEEFTLDVTPLTIEVLPLPSNAPTSFAGAVGEFSLESRIVPEQVQVGEPVTWTLELSGTGNWPAGIGGPSRTVSSSFRAIQPEVRSAFAENELFTGSQSEDIVLIPTEAGSYQLGPLEYSYFDPEAEAYQTITIPATTITVAATARTPPPANRAGERASDSETEGQDPHGPLSLDPLGENTASRPVALPKEPAHGITPMPVPTGSVELLRPTLIAILAPVALWLILALVKTLTLDPSRRRRAAFRRLRSLADQPLPSDPLALREQQFAWRRETRIYWNVSASEPTPAELREAVRQQASDSIAERWQALWKESDRILYSGRGRDAERWRTLFKDALQASPRPGLNLSPFFSRPAWIGILALSVTTISLLPQADANDAEIFYDAGDFASAEREWVAAVNAHPQAWEPRYNAGLAAAQQEDWGRAWAYWASAYCLNPHDERIAWNLRVAQTHTNAYDPTLRDLLEREGVYRLVSARSPAQWERLAPQFITAAGGMLCLAVLAHYLPRLKKLALPLLLGGALCGLAAYFAQWAHSKYGPLASPDTILVTDEGSLRSIPSDLGDPQLTTPLSEGTVAELRKTFIGTWSKVALPNGDEGWIRSENTLPLYQSIPELPDPS